MQRYALELDKTSALGGVMEEFTPHVVNAKYIKDYVVEITFNDGQKKIVDLEAYTKRKGVFSVLKSKAYFKNFFVDLNTICWPNGADVAPERLYELDSVVDKCVPALNAPKTNDSFFQQEEA